MNHSNFFIIFLVFYEFTVYMANDIIMPGMVQVVREFHSSDQLIPLSMSIYVLGGMLFQWLIGPISDRLGRRPTMIFGCLYFSLFTLLITLSITMESYLAFRLFQGVGLSFITVCGYASVQELFEEKKAVRVIAWMSSVAILAPLTGPIMGGALMNILSWRWLFLVLLCCSLLSALGLGLTMPESVQNLSTKKKRLPLLDEIKTVFRTYTRILKNRRVVLGAFCNGLANAPLLCWISTSPIILLEQAHISPKQYGLVQIPIFGSCILGNAVLRKLTHHYSLTQILKIGTPICIGSLLFLFFERSMYPNSYWSIIIPLSFYCFGAGIISAPLARKALYASAEAKGSVSAVVQFIAMGVLVFFMSLMPLFFSSDGTAH